MTMICMPPYSSSTITILNLLIIFGCNMLYRKLSHDLPQLNDFSGKYFNYITLKVSRMYLYGVFSSTSLLVGDHVALYFT